MSELLRRRTARSFIVLQIAAGVALLPMILHSMFDFAIHIPANAMWFATLAGAMFHVGVAEVPVQTLRSSEPAQQPLPLEVEEERGAASRIVEPRDERGTISP
jgi:hypothetical protein